MFSHPAATTAWRSEQYSPRLSVLLGVERQLHSEETPYQHVKIIESPVVFRGHGLRRVSREIASPDPRLES